MRLVRSVGLARGIGRCPDQSGAIVVALKRASPPCRQAARRPRSRAPAAAEGQTETEWGRIWDTPPAGFPVFPEATLSEEAATGPATAVYVAEGAKPAAIATWYQDAFSAAGFFTDSLSGPFEDGGYILEASGDDPACRLSLTIAPLGGTVGLTLLYGAACPR